MENAASPFHKINLDLSHGTLYGNLDARWIVHQWRDKIAHVHLKDAVGEPIVGKFLFPLLGEGRVDWKAFFLALEEIDYRGFCSVEFESFAYYKQALMSDPEAAARLSFENIETLLQRTEA
jgi:sugar phosphate isomerase/epimerase